MAISDVGQKKIRKLGPERAKEDEYGGDIMYSCMKMEQLHPRGTWEGRMD
jgi:hypothetical protein